MPDQKNSNNMYLQGVAEGIINKEKMLVKKVLELNDDQIEFNDIGWTSRVYIVNKGQYVFKFPRSEEVKKEYIQEINILKLLEKLKTNVKVPKIRYADMNNDFLGYEGIIGKELDKLSSKLSLQPKKNIGREIGKFLKILHKLSLKKPNKMTISDEINEFQEKYSIGLKVIEDNFDKNDQAKLAKLVYDEMPSRILELGEDSVLCHGDLGYWNIILLDDGSVGVIDFGDVGYYDKSKDFIGLSDEIVLDEALKQYGDDRILRQKIKTRQKVLPILDLPFAIGKKDDKLLKITILNLKRQLSS